MSSTPPQLSAVTIQLTSASSHPSTPDCCFRKDKYQKKLLWYWCDIAYEGTKASKDEEELIRDTSLGDDARVSEVPLGLQSKLPEMNSDEEEDNDADDDDDDNDDEEDEEGVEMKQGKLGKRRSKECLVDEVEEAMALNDIIMCATNRLTLIPPSYRKKKKQIRTSMGCQPCWMRC